MLALLELMRQLERGSEPLVPMATDGFRRECPGRWLSEDLTWLNNGEIQKWIFKFRFFIIIGTLKSEISLRGSRGFIGLFSNPVHSQQFV